MKRAEKIYGKSIPATKVTIKTYRECTLDSIELVDKFIESFLKCRFIFGSVSPQDMKEFNFDTVRPKLEMSKEEEDPQKKAAEQAQLDNYYQYELQEWGKRKRKYEKQKEVFHTTVAKGVFLYKRARPHIHQAVSVMSSRVQKPNESDWRKFVRLLKYLNGTKKFHLTSQFDTLSNCHQTNKTHHDLSL